MSKVKRKRYSFLSLYYYFIAHLLSLVLLPPPLLQPNGIPSRSGIMKEIYDLLILALLWRIVLRFNGEALPAVVIDNKLYLNTTYGIGIAYTFMKFYRWAEEG